VRFVAVGDIFVDVLCEAFPQPGKRRHGKVALRAGGSAVNAALAAAHLGAEASVVGRVGNDAAGDVVGATLEAHGVNAHLARDPDLPTGVAVAFADAVVADRGANARLSQADIPDPVEADVLLVSGFVLFQQGSDESGRAALERFTGKLAAIDLASPVLAARVDVLRGVRRADVVLATAEEARAVTGAEPERAVRLLAERYPIACVKLGSDGALAAREGAVERRAAVPVEVAARFGTGDAFAAAFLLSVAGGDALGPALERACEAGAEAAAGRQ
jgi:sugar/nucleoside kinase (ribokinase family)